MRRKPSSLVCKTVSTPWQVTVFPDSAFRAQEPDCLTIRAALVLVNSRSFFPRGGPAGVLEFYHRKQTQVCRSTCSAELSAVDDGTSHGLVMQCSIVAVLHGPLSAVSLQQLMEGGSLPVPWEIVTDNQGMFSSVSAERLNVPTEPHLLYLLRSFRDRLDAGTVQALWWIDTRDMISDALTKGGLNRQPLLDLWKKAVHLLVGDEPKCFKVASRS